jgi:hypothetical protein
MLTPALSGAETPQLPRGAELGEDALPGQLIRRD